MTTANLLFLRLQENDSWSKAKKKALRKSGPRCEEGIRLAWEASAVTSFRNSKTSALFFRFEAPALGGSRVKPIAVFVRILECRTTSEISVFIKHRHPLISFAARLDMPDSRGQVGHSDKGAILREARMCTLDANHLQC